MPVFNMKITQVVRLAVTLTILWMFLSWTITIEHPLVAFLGVVSIALVCYFSVKMQVLEHQGQPLYFPFIYFLMYWLWLIVEIFKSNIAVAKQVINPAMPIKPILKSISAPQKTEVGRVIFANSITLTPGTVAINITTDNKILVHALHEDELKDLEQGEMGPRVAQLEPPMLGRTTDSSDEGSA